MPNVGPMSAKGSRWMMRSPLPMQIEVAKLGQSKRTLPLNLLHQFNITRSPRLFEPGLCWAVEA